MKLAALYWHYKNLTVTDNHLNLLRFNNPSLPIFGLFGGERQQASRFRNRLKPRLDDWFESSWTDPKRKWIHGDLMLTDWYRKRGRKLNWTHLAVIQWDMLVFIDLAQCFRGLRQKDIILSGFRRLTPDIERQWHWTRSGLPYRKNYLAFLRYIREHYSDNRPPIVCLFMLQVFPRYFFERYARIPKPEFGMLEYKVPMYARYFGCNLRRRDLGVWGFDHQTNIAMTAQGDDIPASFIRSQLTKPNGYRLFHPFPRVWPPRRKQMA